MATHVLPHIAEAETALQTDLQRLQGTWVSVAGRREAELLVAGRLFTFRYKGGEVYMGAFWLDPSRAPRAMDMRIDEGPGKHRGRVALCVYDLDGEQLRGAPPSRGPRNGWRDFLTRTTPNISRWCSARSGA